MVWLLSIAAVLITVVIAAIRIHMDRTWAFQMQALGLAKEYRVACLDRLNTFTPHILERTDFIPSTQQFSIGFGPWKKRYRPRIFVLVSESEDAHKLDSALKNAIEEYWEAEADQMVSQFRPVIEYRRKGEL